MEELKMKYHYAKTQETKFKYQSENVTFQCNLPIEDWKFKMITAQDTVSPTPELSTSPHPSPTPLLP